VSLPLGFRVRLAHGVIIDEPGRFLVGGSPLTSMRLKGATWARLRDGIVTVDDAISARLADRLLATNLGLPELTEHAPAEAGEITVVLPVRDRPAQLDRALAALSPLRCVVVDDASASPRAIVGVCGRHGADLVELTSNLGPAGARNAGLARVTTPYVAFVDSDVEVTASDLARLTRHFADPAVSLVGPRITGVARSESPRWFERYDAEASSLALGRTPCTVRRGAAVAWLPSACLVARTQAMGTGFDPGLRVGEDVDLVWRLVAGGHRVRYDPAVEAFHDARTTMRTWLGRKFVYGSGGAGLAERHGDKLAPAVLTPAYAIAAAALLTRSRWALHVAALAGALGTRAISRSLPSTPSRSLTAARLSARGLVWAVRQEAALMVRHWWPLAVVGATRSSGVRRALTTALVVDGVVGLLEEDRRPAVGAILGAVAGRRLSDLAYGAGLWWGAVEARSARVLMPRRPDRR
jgi:mycofactocin system glycosyltransferase